MLCVGKWVKWYFEFKTSNRNNFAELNSGYGNGDALDKIKLISTVPKT